MVRKWTACSSYRGTLWGYLKILNKSQSLSIIGKIITKDVWLLYRPIGHCSLSRLFKTFYRWSGTQNEKQSGNDNSCTTTRTGELLNNKKKWQTNKISSGKWGNWVNFKTYAIIKYRQKKICKSKYCITCILKDKIFYFVN